MSHLNSGRSESKMTLASNTISNSSLTAAPFNFRGQNEFNSKIYVSRIIIYLVTDSSTKDVGFNLIKLEF